MTNFIAAYWRIAKQRLINIACVDKGAQCSVYCLASNPMAEDRGMHRVGRNGFIAEKQLFGGFAAIYRQQIYNRNVL